MLSSKYLHLFLLYLFSCVPFAVAQAATPDDASQPEAETGPVTPVLATQWVPPVDSFDWIRLDSNEWLKGRIESMYNDSLEFDSDNLDLLTIDWADIEYLRTGKPAEVNIEGIGQVSGKLQIDNETISVINGEDIKSFSRLNLISLTQSGERELDFWAMDLTLSLNVRQGNTNQIDYTGRFNAKRREAKSRLVIDYVGNISRTDAGTGTYVDTAENERLSFTWDIYATRYFYYTPLFAEYYSDPFQNIEQRVTAGVGIGYSIFDTPKVEWNISAGPGYRQIDYISVLPGEDRQVGAGALMVGTTYDYELSSIIDFSLTYKLTSSSTELGGNTHHMLASIETELTSQLDFDVSLMWDRVSEPRADINGVKPEQDDYKLMVGISWSL